MELTRRPLGGQENPARVVEPSERFSGDIAYEATFCVLDSQVALESGTGARLFSRALLTIKFRLDGVMMF